MSNFYAALLICMLVCPLISTTEAKALQTMKMAPNCPSGCKEAEELHLQARKYLLGAKGLPRDRAKAEQLFEQALDLGNARSALQIGHMYFSDYSRDYPRDKRYRYMIFMYNLAREMGCPDAYLVLAKCHENGWGLKKSQKKAIEMLKKGAEAGSLKCMEFYGEHLIREGRIEPGRQWLRRAIDLGNGDAGKALSRTYIRDKNAEAIIKSLRDGARQGSKECLIWMAMDYEGGFYGQAKNRQHAACLRRLYKAIDDFDAPEPIKNFDRICPLPPIRPW